ncbi:MAG: hypothetical protein FWE05_06030 [Defluviitaleaceae bacterium]|nr:hypothetical protein [Defluviitaleaceae bacterium]
MDYLIQGMCCDMMETQSVCPSVCSNVCNTVCPSLNVSVCPDPWSGGLAIGN